MLCSRLGTVCLLVFHVMPMASMAALDVHCPSNCTAALQDALFSGAAHVRIHPPEGGGSATIGSPHHSTRMLANGTDMVVDFMPGLELTGFLNDTFYPDTGKDAKHGYSPQLVTLEIQGNNLTLRGKNTVLRHITSYAGRPGANVRMEGLQFIDPGWDGMYVRGIVGLTLKDCVFVSTPPTRGVLLCMALLARLTLVVYAFRINRIATVSASSIPLIC